MRLPEIRTPLCTHASHGCNIHWLFDEDNEEEIYGYVGEQKLKMRTIFNHY